MSTYKFVNICVRFKIVHKLHQIQNKNNLRLRCLEKQRAAALKASQNLISAIEQGIITEQTKTRLKELETQIMELEFDIEKEKYRVYPDLVPQKIVSFLNSVIKGDIENISVRKAIIKTFIREIILYDDKIIITYNFTDQAEKDKITPENTLNIEKQSEKAVFSLHISSSSLTVGLPNGNYPNTTIAVRVVFFIAEKGKGFLSAGFKLTSLSFFAIIRLSGEQRWLKTKTK